MFCQRRTLERIQVSPKKCIFVDTRRHRWLCLISKLLLRITSEGALIKTHLDLRINMSLCYFISIAAEVTEC